MISARVIATLLLGAAFAAEIRAQGTAPDLSGNWARTTFGIEAPVSGQGGIRPLNRRRADGSREEAQFNVGDEKSPILKPAAAAEVRRRNETLRAGFEWQTPSDQCLTMVPPVLFRVQGMQVLQSKDEVVFLYMQDHQMRHVRLNGTHPANVTPSWYGNSIGHYEGDTLVVDTVGFKTGRIPQVDEYGSPYSEALHVVERYRLVSYEEAKAAQDRNVRENGPVATAQAAVVDPTYKGAGLQVAFTVDDKNFFTMPWSGIATYRKADGWVENVCAENTHEYYSNKDTAVPKADRPDF